MAQSDDGGATGLPSRACDLSDIIREVLSYNGGRFSVEVQKLCFFSDLYAVERYGRRLTNVRYGAYMYGPYSDEIADELGNAESSNWMEMTPAMRDGHSDTRYNASDGADLTKGCEHVIRAAVDKLESLSHDELTIKSRESLPYKRTPGGEPIDFVDHYERGDLSFAEERSPVARQLNELDRLNESGRILRAAAEAKQLTPRDQQEFELITTLRPLRD
ncbi:Panacea domain-containing protein [Halobaculum sp. MBLA0143]|uniref:Panacea domain-containing protein n=1 Tax=Halobaculum sp. MBLA0143 TaxID=3079933 RepID=UPI003526934B